MPFVPRSQIEQQQANAPPRPMPVVENYAAPQTDNSSNTEEQISELNELLVHVLDEIASLKSAIYENTRHDDRNQVKKKHTKTKRRAVEEDESENDASEEESNEKTTKKENETTTRRGGGIDFSSCF